MSRFHSIVIALATAAVTIPVQAARPQFANRGGSAGVARHAVPQRRTVSALPQPGNVATRAPTATIRSPGTVTRRPADVLPGQATGGRATPFRAVADRPPTHGSADAAAGQPGPAAHQH